MLQKTMKDEKVIIQKQLEFIDAQLEDLPSGKLVVCHDSKYAKYYQSFGNNRVYIPKEKRHLAEQLAYKNYLVLLKEELNGKLKIIENYLDECVDDDNANNKKLTSEKFLASVPEFSEKIRIQNKIFPIAIRNDKNTIDKEFINIWLKETYNTNAKYEKNLVHKSISGNMVRSKSECLIDSNLFLNGIPFRYECELKLDEVTLYPDFTILHPKTGKIYYWEHFGLMDNNDYADKALKKIKTYINNKIIPNVNLIITYETKDNPIDMMYVMKVIEYFFCD